MSHYQKKELKDLYRPQDIIFTVVGVICAIAAGVFLAQYFTSFAGI